MKESYFIVKTYQSQKVFLENGQLTLIFHAISLSHITGTYIVMITNDVTMANLRWF